MFGILTIGWLSLASAMDGSPSEGVAYHLVRDLNPHRDRRANTKAVDIQLKYFDGNLYTLTVEETNRIPLPKTQRHIEVD